MHLGDLVQVVDFSQVEVAGERRLKNTMHRQMLEVDQRVIDSFMNRFIYQLDHNLHLAMFDARLGVLKAIGEKVRESQPNLTKS